MKTISIIIPTFRPESSTIPSFFGLKVPKKFEIEYLFVVDNPDASTKMLYNLKKKHADKSIRIFYNTSNRGASYSRNVGINNAKGHYLLFLDDDCKVDQDLLLHYRDAICTHPDSPGYIGLTTSPSSVTSFHEAVELSDMQHFWSISERKDFFYWGITANIMFSREAVGDVRFPLDYPKKGGGEDINFCLRVLKNHNCGSNLCQMEQQSPNPSSQEYQKENVVMKKEDSTGENVEDINGAKLRGNMGNDPKSLSQNTLGSKGKRPKGKRSKGKRSKGKRPKGKILLKCWPEAHIRHPFWKEDVPNYLRFFRWGYGDVNLQYDFPEFCFRQYPNTIEFSFLLLLASFFGGISHVLGIITILPLNPLLWLLLSVFGMGIWEIVSEGRKFLSQKREFHPISLLKAVFIRQLNDWGRFYGQMPKIWEIGKRWDYFCTGESIEYERKHALFKFAGYVAISCFSFVLVFLL